MPDILIDPVLFAVPVSATPQEQADYLKNLEFLREVYLQMSDFDWHFSESIASLLRARQAFPDLHTLKRLLNACYAQSLKVDIDIKRLHAWANQLFESEFDRKIELTNQDLQRYLTPLGYSDVDVQKENISFQPEEFAQRWDESIRDAMKLLCARLCVYAYLKHEFVADLQIATPVLKGDVTRRDVNVFTMVEYLSTGGELVPPQQVVQNFSLLISPDDFLQVLKNANRTNSSAGTWKWDQTESGLRWAIEKEYADRYQYLTHHASGGQVQSLPLNYTFGSHFIAELQKASQSIAYLPKRVVEAAAAIIADQVYSGGRFHTKHLRESEGGGVPGRRRGKDIAWRVYITINHGGWRLNYWRGPDPNMPGHERIEFSLIQKEEDKEKIHYD